MTFKTFAEKIKVDLKREYMEDFPDVQIKEHYAEKLQKDPYNGLNIIFDSEDNYGPVINLDQLYGYLERGEEYDTILRAVVRGLDNFLEDAEAQFDVSDVIDYEKAKPKLYIEVVNAKKNKDLLAKVPHTVIEDLAIVYRILLGVFDDGIKTVLVTNELLKDYGISKEQLHEDAITNAAKLRKAKITPITDYIIEKGMQNRIRQNFSMRFFVLSNRAGQDGAAVIFYPGMMDKIAGMIGGDYYIIFSSVNDVQVVGKDYVRELEGFKRTIKNSNREVSAIRPEKVLSDHLYLYESKTHKFSMVP